MRLLRRVGGVLVLLLSAVGIIGCASGIIGIWMLYQSVSDKVQTISARLDVGLQRASAANQNVGRAIERARADVATVSKESADLGGGGEKGRRASRALRTVIQQQAGPNIDDLGGRLATLSDATVAVFSLLESFQEIWRILPGVSAVRTGGPNPRPSMTRCDRSLSRQTFGRDGPSEELRRRIALGECPVARVTLPLQGPVRACP
jgi:hypothetical protein